MLLFVFTGHLAASYWLSEQCGDSIAHLLLGKHGLYNLLIVHVKRFPTAKSLSDVKGRLVVGANMNVNVKLPILSVVNKKITSRALYKCFSSSVCNKIQASSVKALKNESSVCLVINLS